MQPDFATIQTIKSMSQRNFAVHWQSLCSGSGLPRFSDFAPGNRAHDPKQMIVWAVNEHAGERSYQQVYRSRYVTEAFGENASLQSIPANLFDIFKLGMNACIDNRAITYMLVSTTDADGHLIDCERLLLPFSETGSEVTHVMTSLQLVSFTGTVHRNTIVERYAKDARVTLFNCIESPTMSVPTPTPDTQTRPVAADPT